MKELLSLLTHTLHPAFLSIIFPHHFPFSVHALLFFSCTIPYCCNVLSSPGRWDKMLFVFYPPFPPRSLTFSLLWGYINGAPFKIRWEDETQAVSAHWRVLLLCLIWESLQLHVLFFFFPSLCVSVEHFSSWQQSVFLWFSCVLFHFLHLLTSLKSSFSLPCGLSTSQGVHMWAWKSSSIPLVGFACVCVFIQSCCGILKPFMAYFLTSVVLWPIKICQV